MLIQAACCGAPHTSTLGDLRMARYSRAREKLMDAEYRLAVSEGDVRERLRRAYTPLRRLSAEDLPADLRDEWREILRELTRHGPERDSDGHVWRSSIDHTMSRIRNRTGRRIAERIYRLRAQLLRHARA